MGTDVAGGYSPSMLSAIRSTVVSSRILEDGTDRYDFKTSADPTAAMMPKSHAGATLSLKESLWLATVGGAEACA